MSGAVSGPEQKRRRLLVPREHGAWGQLLVPVACALAVVARLPEPPGSLAAALLAAGAALSCFIAHEPLLVLLGQRGTRALGDDGGRARTLLLGLSLSAVLLGALALAAMPAEGRATLLLPALFGAPLFVLVRRRQEKTLPGELLAAAALSSVAVPVMVAGGKRLEAGLSLWLILLGGFAQATLVVRAVIGRLGPWPARRGLRVAAALVGVSLIVPVALVSPGAPLLGAALLPVGVTVLVVALRAPHPRTLRTIGWATATASLASAVLIFVAIR